MKILSLSTVRKLLQFLSITTYSILSTSSDEATNYSVLSSCPGQGEGLLQEEAGLGPRGRVGPSPGGFAGSDLGADLALTGSSPSVQ